MKYRTKLYLFFVAISIISILSSLSIVVFKSRKAVFAELQSKAIVVAAGASIHLDGDLVKKIQTEADQTTPAYIELQESLRKHRDANRRKDLYIKYLYITRPDPNNPNEFTFVVDPEEKIEDFSTVGQPDPGSSLAFLQDHLKEPYAFEGFTEDQWGIWLTGNYPIFDSQGNYVASVGADISAERVNSQLNRLLLYALATFIFSLALAMFAAAFLSRYATKALETLEEATIEIAKPNFKHRIQLNTKDEFEGLANSMNQMCEGLEEKDKLKTGFSHYVSKHLLDQIVKEKGVTKLDGEKRKITVLFADIRGFTHIAEQMDPEKVVQFLNEYFKVMLAIIFKHKGILDKFIGDGILAEFGAIQEDPQQEKNAVNAAMEMYQSLMDLREKWKSEGKPELDMGIGVHTGDAIIGTIGTEERMEFTAIGDTVNIASRLLTVSKETRFPIIISEVTFNHVKNEFPYKALGEKTLIGREHPINVYAILHPGYDAGADVLPPKTP